MHRLRYRIAGDAVSSDFRCPHCNGLYEVIYAWTGASPAHPPAQTAACPTPTPSAGSGRSAAPPRMAVDQSGVWRFRDLLPIVNDLDQVVTLREGNTPLYELPRCAKPPASTGCSPSTRA